MTEPLSLEDRVALDVAGRELARTCFDRPIAVAAGAGTGKTTTLVARVLSWCIGPGWAAAEGDGHERAVGVLKGVAAITFTDAAASEMAARVCEGFAALQAGEQVYGIPSAGIIPDLPEQALRAGFLLAEVDRLGVSTIHSFCRRILASSPFEAGLHPSFELDESGEGIADVIREVVREDFVAACRPEHRLRDAVMVLGERGIGPGDMVDALVKLVAADVPASALARDPFTSDVVDVLLKQLQTHSAALLGVVLQPATEAGLHKKGVVSLLIDGLAWLRDAAGSSGSDSPAFVAFVQELAERLPSGSRDRVKKWSLGAYNKGETAAFLDCMAELESCASPLRDSLECLDRVDVELFQAARSLLEPSLERVHERRRELGLLGYGDLLAGATRLLASQPEVLSRVRGEIDQLLVDEFQDTNPIQCQLVELLALHGPPEERPGLFIVGDPKQAIYGWRGADLAAYEGFLEGMRAQGGEAVSLVVNRRSRQVILDEVDRVMAPVMRANPGLQPAFEPLLAAREDAAKTYSGPGAAVEYWVSSRWDSEAGAPLKRTVALQAVRLEAKQLAADLARLHRSGQRLSRVGVLFRSGGHLEYYLEALRDQGVPFLVERDKGYYRRREIVDAISLVRCVLEPADQVALLGFLRSPWVGLPDAALIPLWLRGFPGMVFGLESPSEEALKPIREVLSLTAADLAGRADIPGLGALGPWQHSVMDAVTGIGELREAFEQLPADRFVDRLRDRFAPEWLEAARYQGGYRLANLGRFFSDLSKSLADSTTSLQTALRRLRTYLADQRDAEEARPDAPLDDAVRILTMHKAKGLDFDHVYLPQLHKMSGGQPPQGGPGTRSGGALSEGVWELELFGKRSLGWAGVLARAEEVGRYERIRLLYVAITRARDRLVVMGNWFGLGKESAAPEDVRSILELARWRVGGFAAEPSRMAQVAELHGFEEDANAARWVYPALDDRAVDPLEILRPLRAPSSDRVRADCQALALLRSEAASRQARPLGGAVSTEAHRAATETRDATGGPDEPTRPGNGSSSPGRSTAAAVGTAVHGALEHIDLQIAPEVALVAALEGLETTLAGLVEPADLSAALGDAKNVLSSCWSGALGELLRSLGGAVVARELDFIAPPSLIEDSRPLHYLTGAIDLVYVDPKDGKFVVADFKTDRVSGATELAERASRYRGQLLAYAGAVQQALGLDDLPRAELWFLRADVVVPVPSYGR